MKRYEVIRHRWTVTSPGNICILCLSGVPSKRVNACPGLTGGKIKQPQLTLSILSLYDSTYAGG